MEFILETCVGICADGTPSVVDSIKGLVSFVIRQIPNITATYCFMHRRGLLAKTLGSKLKDVSDQGVETVNFMKTRPACIFELLFESMDSQFKHLLLHTQVKWLSKGKILLHFFELLECEFWISKLEYLPEMQNGNENLLLYIDRIKAFQKKLTIWKRKATSDCLEMFHLVRKGHVNYLIPLILGHLTTVEGYLS